MSVNLLPPLVFQGLANGQTLVGGQLASFVAGTTTPQATWVDSTQTTQNTNPIVLNASGQASVWVDPTLKYKFVLNDQSGNLIGTQDNVATFLNAFNTVIGPPGSGNALTVNSATTGFNNGAVLINVLNPSGGVGNAIFGQTTVNDTVAITLQNFKNGANSLAQFSLLGGTDTAVANIFMTNTAWAAGGLTISNLPAGQNLVISTVAGGFGAFPLCLVTNFGVVIECTPARQVIINTPTTGNALTVNGSIVGTTTLKLTQGIGINGVTPPTRVTGWGTPTGPAVTANYNGAAATLPQTSAVVAEIITALINLGLFGA